MRANRDHSFEFYLPVNGGNKCLVFNKQDVRSELGLFDLELRRQLNDVFLGNFERMRMGFFSF